MLEVMARRRRLLAAVLVVVFCAMEAVRSEILTPPYFNLAEGRKVYASATCGEDTEGPELYCKLVGPTNAENDVNVNVIQGQHCDVCDPSRPDKAHPPENAVDGGEAWWQSPPLSRGMKYNEVNLTIDLGQEFHVAYVYLRMGNSPRPGLWILEKSVDYGKSYTPWQYFSDSPSDCVDYFGAESLDPITKDDSVVCSTDHSKIVPLEGGEIPISLLNNRPSANHYFNSSVLQEWTRATNVRLRLLRTKNLYGHLMSVARQDPTVTRRYFYSIKDISIGGRCMCNGHADTCDNRDPKDQAILVCLCRHHTCGPKCDSCCPGFEQKAWRQSKSSAPFKCEPCNCFSHSNKCVYDPEVDKEHKSLDIYGKYEGGGVCQNCQHNTEGINCNKCMQKFYRPYSKSWNETDVCQPCDCNKFYSTGNCAEGSGLCECRKEYNPPNCDSCSFGHYGYPNCKVCDCFLNGTLDLQCQATNGTCSCNSNFGGDDCGTCAEEYFNFPTCESCECNPLGSSFRVCDKESGNCTCKSNYGGKRCEQCQDGYYSYPSCPYCNCDSTGTQPGICNKTTGRCICKEGYGGDRCDQCVANYFGYPDCKLCNCSLIGSASTVCDATGKCPCLSNFAGRTCEQCSPGYFKYPECLSCNCDSQGAIGITCNDGGVCQCQRNFDGDRCEACMEGFYNFPACEDCNCNPAGVIAAFAGCGSVPKGELCQCKDRVEGRICDKCKPLYWNLNMLNSEGCEECSCHIPGVLGGIAVCDNDQGYCTCKPAVASRTCSECDDGSFDLREENMFGCTDCGCDVGGSVGPVCDKLSGQCQCQPRVTGRTCAEPLQMHYFPTLYQYQYEVEDGRTQDSDVRSAWNETEFPDYSWKGYAVFNSLQREIMKDIYIYKPSLYRMVFRYVNKNPDSVMGTIKIVPENPSDIEQKYHIHFKNSSVPAFATVTSGSAPIALVMNPGKWTISILAEKNLLLDYFVLLPEEYYMASILNQRVDGPCKLDSEGPCRDFVYPNVTNFDATWGAGGYIDLGSGDVATITENFEDFEHLSKLGVRNKVPLLNKAQKEIDFNVSLSKPGRYILLTTYITPQNTNKTHEVVVGVTTSKNNTSNGYDRLKLYDCPYRIPCRQVVVTQEGIVGVYNADENIIHVKFKGDDTNVGIQSVVAIPYEKWSLDFIQPRPVCIHKDGACLDSSFPNPPESKKIQFEKEAISEDGHNKTIVKTSNKTTFIYLDPEDNMVDIRSKVSIPGMYTFIVQFYQPEFPEFDIDVLIQNGQFYEAVLPVRHCPSRSGCRSAISQKDWNKKFFLTENFVITLKLPKDKNVYLDYLLVMPNDLYSQRMLEEEGLDRTGEFISTCANNHFYIDTEEEGFCKDSVFSITSGYNNGALSCQCDFDGSLSFKCEPFGGQCPCKDNVIGRQCSICKSSYYGFPDCKACNCPSTSTCDSGTGQCICPPNVIGEQCDQCAPLTYGFDPINPFSGCDECRCNALGVERDLQCDINNGSCPCKRNIVGRKCDSCHAGFFAFPYCEPCECDTRGTTSDICDQQTAECYCKKFVTGPACDICHDGTYDLQEKNDIGCTECFCFGRTTRCYSSSLYRVSVVEMNGWTAVVLNETDNKLEKAVSNLTLHNVDDSTVGVDLSGDSMRNKTVYFSAPPGYLGKKLTAYGGFLKYSVFYTLGESGKATMRPDVILEGANTYLTFNSLEQPAAAQDYVAYLEIVESNFVLPNGSPAKREHLMMALKQLKGIYIRATYWSATKTSRLTNVALDDAVKFNGTSYYELASSVEQCDCPPNYMGLSCEECAPGYYRTSGPHGGYCVACQCNGHAEECDVNTGICLDCQHSTIGDHCENCAVGYHGNAQQGTPKDCLICACPLPTVSNNFAKGCEVSADGEKISCDCYEGYFGARCQSCASGYYGRPDHQGDYCKPCNCSGNINPYELDSCDTVSGQCLKCLNNTYGEACALCAPGYFGDAIVLKDCQTCVCDETGTERCNSYTGECVCKQNVIGDKCDACKVHHYGFSSGNGCLPCGCGDASVSLQCDDATGQCRCEAGVTGRTCDRCTPGYWNYTKEGCVSCGCKSEYSRGFGCNAQTGQCECLPHVTGDKCDSCPYRWAFVPDNGCFECDSCTDDLLNFTDELYALIDPVKEEFDAVDSGYFTTRRLAHINDTIQQLRPKVLLLSPDKVNLRPITQELDAMEQDSNNMNRKANYSLDNSKGIVGEAHKLRLESTEALEAAKDAADDARNLVDDIEQLAINLVEGEGPRIDTALEEGKRLLDLMKIYNLTDSEQLASDKLEEVLDLLTELNTFKKPFDGVSNNIKSIKDDLVDFNAKLDDLSNQTQYSLAKSAEAKELYDRNGKDRLEKKLGNINTQTDDIGKNLKDSEILLQNATDNLKNAEEVYRYLSEWTGMLEDDNKEINDTIEETLEKLHHVDELVPKVQIHAADLSRRAEELDNLLTETRNTSENAVKAATAYNEIINAINDAENAAQGSDDVAAITLRQLNNMENETLESDSRSSDLLNEAYTSIQSIDELKPRLELMRRGIRSLNNTNDEMLKNIEKFLENYQSHSLDKALMTAKENAENAQEYTKETILDLDTGFKEILNRTENAKQLPKQLYEANRDIDQVKSQLNAVNEKLPKLIETINNLPSRHSEDKEQSEELKQNINKLRQQIALARDYANRIDVGVKFSPTTTLELRNPDNLGDLSTSTHLSGYFKTEKPYGLLLYLGNGNGTNLRRTKSDDYMALEIENGYPVLTMDIGNGPERIVNPKYVSDNEWYQFIIDRTGLNAKLSIKEELSDGREKMTSQEQVLDGPYSIFNLDKNQSKLFVGSYPVDFKIQENIKQSSFEGEVEGLVVGENPISLWNFNAGYENNQGAQQRGKLRKLQTTGYRFNGNGYAILNSRSHPFRTRSDIQLSFKTFATEGLLFLYGKGNTFIALELRNGKVLYKYNLGKGTKVWHTTRAYNDGQWHTLEASRDGAKGRFIVDNEKIPDNTKDVSGSYIEPDDMLFFGGYPQSHDIKEVTNIDFDGCIDNVIIMGNPVDLNTNVKAYGVIPGCPVKFSRLVSFYPNRAGYVKKDNVSSSNDFRVNLKFKTKEKDGLIFYATDRNQDSGMSLALKDGYLKLISQKTELTTRDHSFNDNEWHVISVRHNDKMLRLDFDDYGYKVTDNAPPPLHILYGDIYIGGLPANYQPKKGMIDTYTPFAGCIGDATYNGNIINFANSTDKSGEVLGKCILDKAIGSDTDVHTVPVLPPLHELDFFVTEEPEIVTDSIYDSGVPRRGDGGRDSGSDDVDDEVEGEGEPEVDEEIDHEITTRPPIYLRHSTTTVSPSVCALPMEPEIDENIIQTGSFRYGTEKDSRLVFKSPRGKYRKQFDFSLDFKTLQKNGIIFYVADAKHSHFVALFMKDGYLNYMFNGGYGVAKITSTITTDDNVWHEVRFSRDGPQGKLVIDDEYVTDGTTNGSTNKIDLLPPFYLGGVAPNIFNQVLGNLNVTDSFNGCIKNFHMNNKPMESPELYGVIPCSEHVEPGVFFSSRGGFIKLKERFKVGVELDVKMDIKPRNLSGLIMSVHGKRDYFIMELDNGALKLTVENGMGPITTRYQPSTPHAFCDGQWHSIQAVKSKSVVTLAVNGIYSDPGVGDHRATTTKTAGFLFLGGHRLIHKAKGLTVRLPYVGCIKNVQLNNIPIHIMPEMAEGSINIGSCPTN